MHACHVLCWAAVSTYNSPHDHFDGIRDVSLALSQLWLLAEAMFLQSLKSFGFRASLSFRDVFDSLLPPVLFCAWFPDQFVFEAIDVVWYSGQVGGEK